MANTKKGFNFRNGLQVDDDNVVINSLGAVGIGSTIPQERLVVGENAKIHGNLIVEGTITNTTSILDSNFNNISSNRLHVGVTSISNGIITATSSSGIVTYYGDARYLQGMPTSQWIDIDVGLGYTSIYAAGNVGVGTDDPRFVFQVSGNTDTSKEGFTGVGIQSGGHILAAGIVTAYEFSGFGTGITYIPNASLVNSSVSYGGVSLALGESDNTPAFDLTDATNYPYDSLTGVTTTISGDTTPKLGGNLDLNSHDILGIGSVGIGTTNVLDGFIFQVAGEGVATEDGFINGVGIDTLGNILATGIVTANTFSGSGASITNIPNSALTNSSIAIGGITLNLGDTDDTPAFDLTDATNYPYGSLAGVTTTISGDTTPKLGGNLDLNNKDINGTGNITVSGGIGCDGLSTSSTLKVGIDADGTLGSMLNVTSSSIGIGSYGNPNATVHIRRPSSEATLQLTGNSGASITIGTSESSLIGYNGQIRYAFSGSGKPYSGYESLDIINYGNGNINSYLQAGTVVGDPGSFIWHDRTSPLMTLTYEGNLGIGKTDPEHKLHVAGISTFAGDAHFESNVTIENTLTAGSLSIDQLTANLTGNVNGNLDGTHVNVTGVSTFAGVKATFFGIGTDRSNGPEVVVLNASSPTSVLVIDASGNIGVGTTDLEIQGINAPRKDVLIAGVGIGTTRPKCAVDFTHANNADILGQYRDLIAYVLFPKLTTTQRNNLTNVDNTGVEDGAIIYNTDNTRLELKLPNGWCGIATVE